MVTQQLLDAVRADIRAHCLAKGFREGPTVNNFVPHDSIAAFAMAEQLARAGFDHWVAIAPEGHIYGYFFEQLGTPVRSVVVDYPPTASVAEDDLRVIAGGRVLLIEDDVIGGRTLRLVVNHLRSFAPASLSLYLGHSRSIQHLQNVPPGIAEVYLTDDAMPLAARAEMERRFEAFFLTRTQ